MAREPSIWERMSAGDADAFNGLPWKEKGTGDGNVLAGGKGTGGNTGSPHGAALVATLTAEQRKILENLYKNEFGAYPESEFQFETWLRHQL
jgi:hypothetical protein